MKRVVIYTRGNNEAMQEIMCKLYAVDKGYKVLYVTNDIENINGCDILLVTNHYRISRDKMKYYQTLKELTSKGIALESVSGTNDNNESFFMPLDFLG